MGQLTRDQGAATWDGGAAPPVRRTAGRPSAGRSAAALVVAVVLATLAAVVVAVTGLPGDGPVPARAATPAPSAAHVLTANRWSVVPSPSPGTGTTDKLEAVSCVSRTFCMAVGATGTSTTSSTLAEEWNGSSWSLSPTAAVAGQSALTGVSCLSATFCIAVGLAAPTVESPTVALTEKWTGSGWTTVGNATVSGATSWELSAISCTTVSFCMAVGSVDGATLGEEWNGSSFFLLTTTGGSGSELLSVSCVTSILCLAVGDSATSTATSLLTEKWNGASWSTVASPSVPSSLRAEYQGVSCATASFCVGVGEEWDNSSVTDVVDQWNGTSWSHMTGPGVAGYNSLFSVDCVSTTSCAAVGDNTTTRYGDGPADTAFYNGTSWVEAPAGVVSAASPNEYLYGVSCAAGWGCAGVGFAESATLIEQAPLSRYGYYEVASDGGVFAFGAPFAGSIGGTPLVEPVVGMAATPDGGGYWEVAADGGIFAYGDAGFYGSIGGHPLNQPVVGIAPTADGKGYWEVAADGGIFAFGDAAFDGSMGGQHLNAPIVGIAPTPDGKGYYEVAADGGIFAFGDVHFLGSMGGQHLNAPIVGIAAAPAGGYYEVASDGGLFAFGVPFDGSMGGQHLNRPIVGLALAPGGGYYEVASDGGLFAFGGAPFLGSTGGSPLNRPVVGMAA